MASERELLGRLLASIDAGEPVVLATVVRTARSVPRHAGSKMLVDSVGNQFGTIGGGEMEARVVAAAREALTTGRTEHLEFDLLDPADDDPGVCGGSVTIYLEPYMPQPHLLVVGCGHVGRAVVELAHWLGFRVTALDDRPDVATAEALPLADRVVAGPLADSLADVTIDEHTHVVLLTRNVDVDCEVLPIVLETPAASVGVMGSTRRWTTTRSKLAAAGLDEDRLDQVSSPLGVDIHAETPEEIALSVLGEIVSLRRSAGES